MSPYVSLPPEMDDYDLNHRTLTTALRKSDIFAWVTGDTWPTPSATDAVHDNIDWSHESLSDAFETMDQTQRGVNVPPLEFLCYFL